MRTGGPPGGRRSSAFYTRQFYVFVPVVCAWALWRQAGFRPAAVACAFGLAALPELGLVLLWHGLNPPAFHHQARPGWSNVLFLGTNLALFAAPLVIGARAAGHRILPPWWDRRATLGWASAFACPHGVSLWGAVWPDAGGGVLVKASLRLGWLATPAIAAFSLVGLSAALIFALRSRTNAVAAGSFLPPFFIAYPIYERYFDPVVLVGLLLFADLSTARALSGTRPLLAYLLFTATLLGVSLWHFAA